MKGSSTTDHDHNHDRDNKYTQTSKLLLQLTTCNYYLDSETLHMVV